MTLDPQVGTGAAFAIVLIAVVGALAHGAIGFGFPIVSTPLVALLIDVKTAVLVTVIPNVAINLISILRGGRWRESVGQHWPVAICVVAGTLIGTRVLLLAPPEPLRLVLAAMILVYLQQDRLRGLDWSWIARAPRAAGMGFGLLGGILSGAVNVAAPPLIIYFMTLQLGPVAMTQTLNLCFLAGKTTQATSLAATHAGATRLLAGSVPLAAIAVAALLVGMRLQSAMRPETYRKALRATLWMMAFLLVGQVVWKLAFAAR